MEPAYPKPTRLPPINELPDCPDPPDLLQTRDGKKVASPIKWRKQRRPELQRLAQHYIYGYLPEPIHLNATIGFETTVFNERATLREVVLSMPESDATIRLLLVLPSNQLAPVFLGLNKCGNHTVLDHSAIRKPTGWVHPVCEDADRGDNADVWCIDTLIDRGYGFATIYCEAIAPDDPDAEGEVDTELPKPGPASSNRGVLATWAWGLHRAVDYLVTTDDITNIATIGHSRRGKASLLAAAMDRRIDLVVPHQSGCGGVALSRECDQGIHYTVDDAISNHPYWYAERFSKFAGREHLLPLDQHALVALVAPRPLLDTEGLRDQKANYAGALDSLRAAAPVYELLNRDIGRVPLLERESITEAAPGPLAQYRLDTDHVLNRDYWTAILDFADLHL